MRFLICDDHPFLAQAMAMALEQAFDAELIVTHGFAEASAMLDAAPGIDLCLADFHIPGEDSRTGLQQLRSQMPEGKLLIFSASDADHDLRAALEVGADGFLPKSATPEVVEAAVRLVLAGGKYLPERVGTLALDGAAPHKATHDAASSGPLTKRQQSVLGLVAEGLSNKEIAIELGISPATVKIHVAQLIGTLYARNRTEAVSNARRAGLI